MKVLREGRSWLLEHECTGWLNGDNGCGALLGLERSDLRYYKTVNTVGVKFKCVCCGVYTDLGINDWPNNPGLLTHWTPE